MKHAYPRYIANFLWLVIAIAMIAVASSRSPVGIASGDRRPFRGGVKRRRISPRDWRCFTSFSMTDEGTDNQSTVILSTQNLTPGGVSVKRPKNQGGRPLRR